MILTLDKPPGWTPLEALEAARARADEPMVYAGRLDPMAEGLLLVLTGEDRHALPHHLAHDKDYEATFLFGVASDTHDALGRLRRGPAPPPPPRACGDAVAALVGTHPLRLPAWSAYRVRAEPGGPRRPLHAWAAEGRDVERPARPMVVTHVSEPAAEPVAAAALLPDLRARIERVTGAFRQGEALADWEHLAAADPPLVAVRARLTVTSGTYVRALAEHVGASIGCGALLLTLRRTRVGPYRLG